MNPIIQSFYNQISWVDECSILQIDGIEFVKTDIALYLPCDWKCAESSAGIVSLAAEFQGLEPVLIVGGDPSREVVEQIYINAIERNVVVIFVDAAAIIAKAQFITQALDGIDWPRTMGNIAKGNDTPVWEWE
jgi:hypothetical protein